MSAKKREGSLLIRSWRRRRHSACESTKKFLGPCDAYITKPAFLLNARVSALFQRATMRQKPFFKTYQIDFFELQSFGCVKGH